MKGEHLGEFEELVLLSVRIMADDASGATIQEVLETDARRPVSLGAIYAALDRLARKGFVDSELGDPTPKRGGRRRRFYKVTAAGVSQLEASRSVRDAMWKRASEASSESRGEQMAAPKSERQPGTAPTSRRHPSNAAPRDPAGREF